ncbi:hypothetical protein BKA82DRAFT_2387847 [Pisolithus tinctorius]|nr:hypothetical protein BKA82DRAFT_2387847 [Pisolithus tinctorius]
MCYTQLESVFLSYLPFPNKPPCSGVFGIQEPFSYSALNAWYVLRALSYISFNNFADMSLSEPILVLALVTLSLSGDMPPWSLQSDSVHFPVLDTLKIWLGGVDDFFKAIVTPRLKSLDYTALVRFRRLRWPWRQVSFTIAPNSLRIQDAEALC